MDITIGLVIFAIGLIAGIFVQKILLAPKAKASEVEQKLNQREQELTQYKLDVAEHLDNSAVLLKQMNETCQVAMAQMEKSTEILQRVTPEPTQEELPFFSEQITAELQQTISMRNKSHSRQDDTTPNEAPKDYSGNSSGIFSDTKQTVTNG